MKLKLKLSLMVIIIMVLVVSVVSIILVQRASKISRELSKDKITYLARQRAQYWSGRIDGYLQVLRTISDEMNYYENVAVEQRRTQYEETMRAVFEDQPDFVRMFTIWKPNAIDGRDSST